MALTVTYSLDALFPKTEVGPVGADDPDITAFANGGWATSVTDNFTRSDFTMFDAAGNIIGLDIEFATHSKLAAGPRDFVLAVGDGYIDDNGNFIAGTGIEVQEDTVKGDPAFVANFSTLPTESKPDIAFLPGTNSTTAVFAVVDQRSFSGADHDIELHLRSVPFNTVSLDIPVDTSLADDENPAIVALNDGGFAISWERIDGSGHSNAWVAVYNFDGTVRLAPTDFDNAGTINHRMSMTALQSGGFAVAYEDNGWNTGNDVTVTTFDANGTIRSFNHAGTQGTDDSEASVTTLSNGLVITTFTQDIGSHGDLDLRATLIDPTGIGTVLSDPSNPLSIDASADITSASSVAALDLARFAVDYENANTGAVDVATFQLVRTVVGTSAADTFTGDDAVNKISGLGGNDVLTGGNNADTIDGGTGNDRLFGLGGNDMLIGGSGSDTMIGGAGDDTYVVDSSGDIVDETGGDGTDLIQSSVAFSLSDAVHAKGAIENLTLTGSTGVNATGNALDNHIVGNSGNNILIGLGGADILDGGAGTDTASYASSATGINVSLATGLGHGGDAEGDTVLNVENLTGSAYNDTLEGNGGNNVLYGGAGIDTVSYLHAAAGVTVSLAISAAQNTVGAGTDTIMAVENLTGSSHDDFLTGNGLANILIGGDGNDTLNGGSGADTMIGGVGNDTYVVDNSGDIIDETGGDGTDLVQSSVAFSLSDAVHAKGAIENLTLTGSTGVNATGNALDNHIVGNSGNNILIGLGGADILDGGAGTDTVSYASSATGVNVSLATGLGHGGDAEGDTILNVENLTGSTYNDTLEGDGGNNVLNGGAGIDTITFLHAAAGVTVSLAITTAQNTIGAGTDTITAFENLTGSTHNDVLTGSSLANVITGGAGNDTLTGGAGSDTFVFKALFGTDTINDFAATGSSHDIIQFDANVFADFAAVSAHMTQNGANTEIAFDASNVVTLKNVTMTNLHADDFQFV